MNDETDLKKEEKNRCTKWTFKSRHTTVKYLPVIV